MPFELAIDPSTLIILAVVAFLAGFIDAIAGGGDRLGGFAKAFDEVRRRAVGQRQPVGNSRPPPLQGTKGDPRRAQRL